MVNELVFSPGCNSHLIPSVSVMDSGFSQDKAVTDIRYKRCDIRCIIRSAAVIHHADEANHASKLHLLLYHIREDEDHQRSFPRSLPARIQM